MRREAPLDILHLAAHCHNVPVTFTLDLMIARFVLFAAALAVGTLSAVHLAAFFEVDACLDAGGRYLADVGVCDVPTDVHYVPLLSRPHLYGFWATFLLLVSVPSWLVLRIGTNLHRRLIARRQLARGVEHEA